MEILFTVISFLLLFALGITPILLFKKLNVTKFKFLMFLGLGIVITAIILLIMGWWSSKSTEILLSQNGFNFDSMDEQERYANVAKENLEQVKNLENSRNGIGWPAKVIMIYPFYLAYILLVYLVMILTKKTKMNELH